MEFEWDDHKDIYNIKKHGISFKMAVRVFEDENRLEYYDEAHSDYEDRYITIGMVNSIFVVLFVSFTERGDITRIISARLATKEEKERYRNDY